MITTTVTAIVCFSSLSTYLKEVSDYGTIVQINIRALI